LTKKIYKNSDTSRTPMGFTVYMCHSFFIKKKKKKKRKKEKKKEEKIPLRASKKRKSLGTN
jgi:hypothetical protein